MTYRNAKTYMPRLTSYSPFPDTNLGNMLALLELAGDGDDPLDQPTPWAWTTWRETLRSDHAPWQNDATEDSTGIPDDGRTHTREFFTAYRVAGEAVQERVRFALDLSEGHLYKGREWLTWWWRRQWYSVQPNVDEKINEILIEAGILTASRSVSGKRSVLHCHLTTHNCCQVLDLDISSLSHPPEALTALACGLFGADVCSAGAMSRPHVVRWLKHAVHFVRLDWIRQRDEPHRRIDLIRQSVYLTCQGKPHASQTPGNDS